LFFVATWGKSRCKMNVADRRKKDEGEDPSTIRSFGPQEGGRLSPFSLGGKKRRRMKNCPTGLRKRDVEKTQEGREGFVFPAERKEKKRNKDFFFSFVG